MKKTPQCMQQNGGRGQLATKKAPRVSTSSPAFVDAGFVEVSFVHAGFTTYHASDDREHQDIQADLQHSLSPVHTPL